MRKLAISTALVLAACGSNKTGPSGNGPDASANTPDADPNAPDADPNAPDANPNAPDANTSGAKPIIFTIVMENHDYVEIVSQKAGDAAATNAPYINSLIKQYGLATMYKDTGHPSLPNYLNMISGANQYPGGVDLDPTFFPFPVDQPNLGDQLTTANIKWRSYQEDTPTPCALSGKNEYAPRHDPFLYFKNIQKRNNTADFCKSISVDYKANFAADLASNQYRYMWITPNLLDDGHDPQNDPVTGLKQSDTWLKNNLQQILDSDGYKAGGIVFLTWDEAEARNGDDPDLIPMIVISNRIKTPGMTSSTPFTHGSYLATIEDYFGLPRLATVTNAKNLNEFLK
jgi:hypothetical protein